MDKVKLQVGDIFQQAWKGCSHPIAFKVLDINREENSLRVRCFGNAQWEEIWDDLDVTENAFSIGEYRMIK